MSINRVTITGNLTRDSELYSNSNTNVLKIGVAVNDRRKNQQTGEWEDVPNYIDCVLFGNRALSLAQYLTKGVKVAIEGKLRWSQWEDKGTKKSKINVIVDQIELMQKTTQERANGQPNANQTVSQPVTNAGYYSAPTVQPPVTAQPMAQPQFVEVTTSYYDEDIPF